MEEHRQTDGPKNKVLHLGEDIDRLYVTRKEGKSRYASIENRVDATLQGLEEYTKKSKERLIFFAFSCKFF